MLRKHNIPTKGYAVVTLFLCALTAVLHSSVSLTEVPSLLSSYWPVLSSVGQVITGALTVLASVATIWSAYNDWKKNHSTEEEKRTNERTHLVINTDGGPEDKDLKREKTKFYRLCNKILSRFLEQIMEDDSGARVCEESEEIPKEDTPWEDEE